MNATSAWNAFVAFCAKVSHWCLWFGKLVIAIGIAYAAARIFSFGNFNVNGITIPVPKVTADIQQLAWLAGCVYLISR